MIVAAVDIGGTKISAGLVTQEGRLLDRRVMPTQADQGLDRAVERIVQALDQMSQTTESRPVGIGVSCTGPVDPEKGVLGPNQFLPGWEGPGLLAGLSGATGLSAVLENDASAAALAEGHWGSGRGCHSFLYVTVSTGIGGGQLLDGALYTGAGGAHPEIGHHVIDPHGPICQCGARGCWESLAAGPALARRYLELLPQGKPPLEPVDARTVFHLAKSGDEIARQAVSEMGFYLGLGLANLISIFVPDRIALGGGVMRAWPQLETAVWPVIQANCRLVPAHRTQIVLAQLEPDTCLLGAAQTWLQRQSIQGE
jgi:glucokinase